MGRPKVLAISVVTDSRRGVAGFKATETAADRMTRRVTKAGKIGGGALLALGAAGFRAAKGAAEDEAAQVRLAGAMRKNAGATDKSIAATERWIDKQARAKGIADDQLRPALATLVRATGNVEKAQKDLSLAMDISAATGKPLEAVSAALAKAYGGSTTALGRLVPGLDKAVVKSGDMVKITDLLAKKVGGDAADAAQTNEGKMRRASVAAAEFEETLGAALLPAMGILIALLTRATSFMQAHSNQIIIVTAVIGALAVAVIAINAVMRVYQATLLVVTAVKKSMMIVTALQTAAQYALGTAWLAGRVAALAMAAGMRLLNAAMKANPIGLLITAITIVIGLFVLAYKRSSTFRSIVQATGRAASTALGWVVDKAKSVGTWFGKLGPAATKVKDTAVAAFKLYLTPIQKVIDLVEKLIGWLKKIKFPKVPGAIKKIGGIVGGGGPPDAPKPPPRGGGGSWGPGGPGSGGFPGAGGSSYSAGGDTYIIQGALDPVSVADQIDQMLTRRARRRGRVVTG